MSNPWSEPKEQVVQGVASNPATGLTAAEAEARLEKNGPNELTEFEKITILGTFWDLIREPMILLLIFVGVVYSVFGELRDAITIFTVIILLLLSEVFTDYRAETAIAALRKLTPATNHVIRNGVFLEIPAEDVVVGDIVPLEAGDKIPADGRIIESYGLQVDESPLTGESAPVTKEDKAIPENAPVTDRANMVFAGTTVTSGTGKAVITATAMETEIGKIHGLVEEAEQPDTPLQKLMHDLSVTLAYVAIFFSVVIPLIGIFQGKPWREMILTGLSMAFAVIPEELPIIITMVLALGGLILARKHILIRNLRAAETLGSVTDIVTDKTGTITQNKMTLSRIATDGSVTTLPGKRPSASDANLLKVGALTSIVKKSTDGGYTGDPLEVALLNAAKDNGLLPENMQSQLRKVAEFAFDNQRKMMSVVYQGPSGLVVYSKGAPEVILARCNRISQKGAEKTRTPEDAALVLKQAQDMAADAMRVIALAYKNIENETPLTQDAVENELIFLGLAGMSDPPRPEIADAIRATREAGIRTIMVTGDLPLTAERIAESVGIDGGGRYVNGPQLAEMTPDEIKKAVQEVSIFARINPAQKLDIVKALQANSRIVAVTGDGINDAPALKSADIGIAMGENGTEAAREASAMVLTNDNYSSIVDGVREGRRIFDNLSKGVMYYLAVKIALVLVFIVPLALGLPFPFAPIQIILLELFMDLAASAAFSAEPIEPDTMHRPPRDPKQRFMDSAAMTTMVLASLSLTAAVLFNYLLAYYGGRDPAQAGTIAFATWMVGHIFLAFTMRSQRETLFKLGPFTNPVMIIWSVAVVIFLTTVTFVPYFHPLMRVTLLTGMDWLWVIAVPFVTVFWYEIKKTFVH